MNRPDLPAFGLCALCVVGIIVLAALHIASPDVLTYVAVGALGGAAGIALPRSSSSSSSTETPAAPPAPAPLTAEPATGVYRVATHAP